MFEAGVNAHICQAVQRDALLAGLDKALTKNRHEPYINRRTFHIIGILYRIWKGRRVPQ